jgi:hypothetical protein
MIENNNLLVHNNQDVLHFDNFPPVFIDQSITPAVILDLFNNNKECFLFDNNRGNSFYPGKIVRINRGLTGKIVSIEMHYHNWNDRFNETISLPNVRLQLRNPNVIEILSSDEDENDGDVDEDISVNEKVEEQPREWYNI